MTYLIILAVWLIGIFVAYKFFVSKWDGHSIASKIYFSAIWPLLLPLALIDFIYKRCK
jgi:hypothetical protein